MRLQLLNEIEPKSDVEDVLFYTYEGDERGVNIALLPIEGLRRSLDKEIARKTIVRKLLSQSFLSIFKDPESIEHLILFTIDALTEVDHCFYINAQTLQYEYCVYDFQGNILLSWSYK